MEDLIASLPVIAAAIIIVIVIFWLSNRNKKKKQQRIINLASKHDWEYEPVSGRLVWGYKLKGSEWVFESISRSIGQASDSGSSNIEQTTHWSSSRAPLSDRLIFIGERPPGSSSGFAGNLIQQAFQLALGSEAAGMSEVLTGTSALRERYLIMSRKAEDAEYLLNPHLEHLLVNFPGQAPLIKVNGEGIQMDFKGRRVEKPEEIESIIRLGDMLLDAQSSSK